MADLDPTLAQILQHMVNSDGRVAQLMAENEALRAEVARLKEAAPKESTKAQKHSRRMAST